MNGSAPGYERAAPASIETQATVKLCQCERPFPRERAEHKWAARTYCERCGLEMPLRWR